ncbi:collagen alpha-1(I) chain-like, partial [Canis lupus familiaris]|uniref:collagen alpha-1(I) chain-like n=1 Tax=Canis lupus familiaris TaxID=9615 RepID=UPI0018F3AA63
MLTTIPPTLHSPGRPRTPAQAPHQRLLALSPPPPPPAAALPRRAGRPQLCAVAGATSGRPAPHPRHPHAALAAPQATTAPPPPPPASGGALAALRLPGPRLPAGEPRPLPPAPARQRAAVRRVSEEPVAASLPSGGPGWAGPSPHSPGRQGARADEEGRGAGVSGRRRQDGPPRSAPRLWPALGPGRGTREEKEDKEEKEEKEGPGAGVRLGQRGGGARDQKRACLASPSGNRTPVSRVTGGDTHHYTNEDGGGGRPGADPSPPARPPAGLPACPRPPGPSAYRAEPVLPGARHVPRATAHPAPTPRPPRQRAQQSPGPTRSVAPPDPAAAPAPAQAARGWRRRRRPTRQAGLREASRRPRAGDGPRRAAGGGGGAGRRQAGPAAGRNAGSPRGPGHAPTEGRASLASSLSQPRPTPPPPARRERGVPTAGSRALRAPARDGTPAPFAGPGPGGRGGVHPAVVAPGSPERKAALPPRAPSAPEAAAGPGLQDASALPHRAARQPASRRPLRPSAPAGLTPPQPSRPDGELRAELTRLSLASWLGRYSAAPISDDDTDADTHTRAPTPPHPAAPRERTQSELRAPAGPRRRALHGPESHPPMGLRGAPGGKGRSALSCAGHRRPALPGNRARVRLGQAAPPGRTVSGGGPAPGRGRRVSRVRLGASLGPWAPRAGPSPSPSPSPSPRRICTGAEPVLQTAGPPPAPAQRVLTTGRAGTTTSAAGEAVWWPPPPVHGWFSGRILACQREARVRFPAMQRAAPFWPRAPGFLAHALKPQGLSLNQLCSRRGPCPPAPPRFPLPT